MPVISTSVRKRRLAVLTLWLEGRRVFLEGAKNGGIPFEAGFCAMAVRFGQYRGKPMDVSAVAEITGMPYATADRHLKILQKLGRVRAVKIGKRSVQYLPLESENPAVEKAFLKLEKLIKTAAENIANAT